MTAGAYGLIIANESDLVHKVLIRFKDHERQAFAEKSLANEIYFLKLLQKNPLGGVETPALISGPHDIKSGSFFAFYTMTRLKGRSAGWNSFSPGQLDTPAKQRAHFTQAGRLLHQFHETARHEPGLKDHQVPTSFLSGNYIPQIPECAGMPDKALKKINRALEVANDYLQTKKHDAVLHDDFAGNNLMVDDQGKITGLLDFGLSGSSGNHLIDFCNVPAESMPYFIEGYEQESGRKIDPLMMTMTLIAQLAESIVYDGYSPTRKAEQVETLRKMLHDARYVTDYTLK